MRLRRREERDGGIETMGSFNRTFWGQMSMVLATTVFGSVITYILGLVTEEVLFWAISLLVPLLAAIYMAWAAHRFSITTKRSEDYNERLLSIIDKMNGKTLVVERTTEHITLHKDSASRTMTFDLVNKMDEMADTFRIGSYTSAMPNKLGEMAIYRDGKKLMGVTEETVRYEVFRRMGMFGTESPLQFDYDLYLPIGLRPGQSCSMKVEVDNDRTSYHIVADLGGRLGQKVHHETNLMELRIELDSWMAERYELRIMNDLSGDAFIVMDSSGNRMRSYESRISSSHRPTSDGSRLEWVVPDPLKDCTYSVTFGLFMKQSTIDRAMKATGSAGDDSTGS